MWSLSERNENQLHHPSAGVFLARHGGHLLPVEQVGEQSLRHRLIQNVSVYSQQFV